MTERALTMIRAALCLAVALAGSAIAADPPKAQNDLISKFVDDTADFKGKTLSFKVAYINTNGRVPLTERVGASSVPFQAKDPKNGAKLLLGLDIPKGLKVPAAKDGEEVIVTFKCEKGDTSKGNTAIAIVRP